MSTTPDLAGMVPGFEFLQSMMKSAGSAIPGMGQWVAPTLDPAEIEKRIQELRTVQFWLEQNARLLATTIQALEVQRMTLSTLQGMNLPMADVRDALKIRTPPTAATTSASPAQPESAAEPEPAADPALKASPAVDPLQWWNALTQQFGQIAAQAVKGSTLVAGAQSPKAAKSSATAKTRPRKTSERKRAA